MEVKAVLFDLDGTILDTEKYYRRAWPAAAAHYGYRMSDEEATSLRSLGRPFAIERIENMVSHVVTYHELREYRKGIFNHLIETEGLQAKAGARELLTWLREEGICAAVVTASGKEYAEDFLTKVDLLPYFDRIISATMVKQGKPAPDVYLFACNELGILPGTCVAVEDSPNGIASASAAGCQVIMIPDQTPSTEEDRSRIVAEFEKLDDIIPYLQKEMN